MKKGDLKKDIEEFDLTFLDLETTGLDAISGDAICEIAAFKVRKRKVIDKFYSLINPKMSMPEEVYRIHKISDEQLKDAPYFCDVAEDLISFLEGSVLCAHNVGFDLGFLNTELRRINYSSLVLAAIDILNMARKALRLRRYNLGEVAHFFNIGHEGQLHRALPDVEVTYQIFFKLKDILQKRGVSSLGDFLSLFGFNNEVFWIEARPKVELLKEAIAKESPLKIRYLSFRNTLEVKKIRPLNLSQERGEFYLLYQDSKGENPRIKVNYILDASFLAK